MKYNCVITTEGVKSKKAFMNYLQIMLDDYDDMNECEDAPSICISVGEKVKENK